MKKRARKNLKMQKYVVIACSVLAVAAACGVGYTLSVKHSVADWENKIYSGVKVAGIDLSGKTKAQAKEELQSYEETINKKVITAKKDDKSYELKYSDMSPKFNIDDTVEEAFKYGKDKGLFEKHKFIKKGAAKDLTLKFDYNAEPIKSFENKISKDLNVSVKNASIALNGGSISVTDDKTGIAVDVDKLDKLIKDSITAEKDAAATIEIPTKVTEPKVKKADLAKIDGKISGFSTQFDPSNVDRSKNLEIAAGFINGTVVMPGDTFSYNDTVGERTVERGFRNGAVFVNNKVEQDVGGGVCQVSTTLYRSIMAAGIKSTERHNHSLKATYSDYGLDATVSWGYLDYKFKNTYDFPIYIQGYTTSNQVVFNVYGNKAGMGGKTYDLVAEKVKDVPAGAKTIQDSTLKEGQVVWDEKAIDGVVVNSYRITYQNGSQIAKEFVAKDTYAKVDGVKRVGTQKAVQPTVNKDAEQKAKQEAEAKKKQEAEQAQQKAEADKQKAEAEKQQAAQNGSAAAKQ